MGRVKRVAVISNNEMQQQAIGKIVGEHPEYEVKCFFSEKDLHEQIDSGDFNALILGMHHFNSDHIYLATELQKKFNGLPLIMMAPDIHPDFRTLVSILSTPCCVVLDDNYERTEILSILNIATSGSKVWNRVHCRFPVNQGIYITKPGQEMQSAKVVNLSKRGAKIKSHHFRYKKDEVLTLEFGQKKRFDSRVAWADDQGNFGVEFLRAA